MQDIEGEGEIADTGANAMVITSETAKRSGTGIKPRKRELGEADGNKLPKIRYKRYIPLISAWGQ